MRVAGCRSLSGAAGATTLAKCDETDKGTKAYVVSRGKRVAGFPNQPGDNEWREAAEDRYRQAIADR